VKYLLDTNILSEPLKAQPNSAVLRKLRLHQSEIATAVPVWHELLYGLQRLGPSSKRKALEEYLHTVVWPTVPILAYDANSAALHATERARLTSLGKTPTFVDGQIAAIAMSNHLCLVTANTKDFVVFTDLQVENWFIKTRTNRKNRQG
jgi:tRNA(fMet)-specific endonuclease VapC